MRSGEHAMWDAAMQVGARRAEVRYRYQALAVKINVSMAGFGVALADAVKAMHEFERAFAKSTRSVRRLS